MDDKIILSPINIDILTEKISERVMEKVQAQRNKEVLEKPLSREETSKIFGITTVTLHNWTKEGRIQEHRIGGRVYYKYSEIMNSLQTLKKYKKVI